MKYKDWLQEWLENYVAPAVKARTYNQYVEISKNRIIPYFGVCEIEDVTPLIVQRYITELMKNGNLKSRKNIMKTWGSSLKMDLWMIINPAPISVFSALSIRCRRACVPRSTSKMMTHG